MCLGGRGQGCGLGAWVCFSPASWQKFELGALAFFVLSSASLTPPWPPPSGLACPPGVVEVQDLEERQSGRPEVYPVRYLVRIGRGSAFPNVAEVEGLVIEGNSWLDLGMHLESHSRRNGITLKKWMKG